MRRSRDTTPFPRSLAATANRRPLIARFGRFDEMVHGWRRIARTRSEGLCRCSAAGARAQHAFNLPARPQLLPRQATDGKRVERPTGQAQVRSAVVKSSRPPSSPVGAGSARPRHRRTDKNGLGLRLAGARFASVSSRPTRRSAVHLRQCDVAARRLSYGAPAAPESLAPRSLCESSACRPREQ